MVHITTFLENFLKKILGELIQVLLNGLSSIFSFKSVPENCFSRNFSMNASGIATMIRSEIPLFIFIDFFENYSISSPDSSSRNSSEYYTAENFFQKCCKEFLQIFFSIQIFSRIDSRLSSIVSSQILAMFNQNISLHFLEDILRGFLQRLL